jgi:hypothetical protein
MVSIFHSFYGCGLWFMVFNATFNNISVILWRSILLVEETEVPGENHRTVASQFDLSFNDFLDWFRTGLTMWYYLFIIISINFIHLINYLYNPTEIWRSIKLRPHDPSLYFADV